MCSAFPGCHVRHLILVVDYIKKENFLEKSDYQIGIYFDFQKVFEKDKFIYKVTSLDFSRAFHMSCSVELFRFIFLLIQNTFKFTESFSGPLIITINEPQGSVLDLR